MNHWKDIREDLDLRQKEVADYLGISRSAYSNYENGSRKPDPDTLMKLADFFRVSVDELLGHVPATGTEFSLAAKEKSLIRKYRALSPKGQLRIQKQVELEWEMENPHLPTR